jgi:hypothetical protein
MFLLNMNFYKIQVEHHKGNLTGRGNMELSASYFFELYLFFCDCLSISQLGT